MQMSPRVERDLKKYAHLIGGVDVDGKEYRQPEENRLKEHLFYVRNRDMDGGSGEFMLGHVIRSKVIDGVYDIEYIGLNRHTRRPRENEEITKEHRKVLDRVKLLGDRQRKDIIQSKIEHLETLGIFTTEEELLAEISQ